MERLVLSHEGGSSDSSLLAVQQVLIAEMTKVMTLRSHFSLCLLRQLSDLHFPPTMVMTALATYWRFLWSYL